MMRVGRRRQKRDELDLTIAGLVFLGTLVLGGPLAVALADMIIGLSELPAWASWIMGLAPVTMAVLLSIGVWNGLQRRTDRSLEGRCQECGYDLRASKDRCPECGEEFAKQE